MESYQARVTRWVKTTFSPSAAYNIAERAARFFEEAIELVQASDMSQEEAHALVDYVFSSPKGIPFEEGGDALLTLHALCSAQMFTADIAGERALAKNEARSYQIREKWLSKPSFRAARPENSS